MSWKNTQQASLADALVIEHKSLSELDDVHNIIFWPEIEQTLSGLYSSVRGAPAYPPLMMFKILILQAWYNLSDEALEKQIARDLMFRRFIDLSLSESVPDHSSIWRFRQLLNTQGLLEPLLEQINAHLERNSIIVSLGSINIIDATVIEAKQSRKRKGKDGNNTQDKDKLKVSGQVYADSAYANKLNDKKLGKHNNKILHRAYRNKPLTQQQQQKQDNKQRSSIRYVVERTFGLLKLHHGLGKARYLGLQRNKTRAQLIAMSHNLKTGMNIFKEIQQLKDLRDYCVP